MEKDKRLGLRMGESLMKGMGEFATYPVAMPRTTPETVSKLKSPNTELPLRTERRVIVLNRTTHK